ncbi:ATP-binding cassette domain-containing protein [Mucilaginibacter terrae]|uniref:ATP-binding cassette domain-containing protein n=1 Tax=Mucilaginibacter terrae TaxID=1955052 RepID=UPI00363EAD6E
MLKVDSVYLEFDSRKVLQDIYIDSTAGKVTGLLGRNGCGKSSLLKIIFGTLQPAHQYISINGQHVSKGYLKNKIAYLPQHNYLPGHLSIRQSAQMLVDEQAWEEFTSHDVYSRFEKMKPGELSGGELRKLETLMILYSKATYILLDEPFTHISPLQVEEIKAIIRKRCAVKGFIVTDHQYRNILEISDKLVLLQNGATKIINDANELVAYGYLSNI